MNKKTTLTIISCLAITLAVSGLCTCFSVVSGVLCLALGLSFIALYVHTLRERNKKLNELNNYLSLICSGNYNLDLNENTEGELSILKNNLYKVITILQTQKEVLEKDKSFLADNLADISHQLKTPLTSIMVLIDLVKTEQDEEKRKEFIDIIESQLDKTKWLISNLLKISKLDADTVKFNVESVSVKALVQESVKPFLVSMDLKNISFVDTSTDATVNVDFSWTSEAIMNVVKNCIEHTDKNGTLSISSTHTNLYDSIIIKDNGKGIAKEDLPHIFERFYHGKNSSSESVGIGLALTKEILLKQNGSISVKSTENVGTEFEIKLYNSVI